MDVHMGHPPKRPWVKIQIVPPVNINQSPLKWEAEMGGEFTYPPKWDPKTVLTTTAKKVGERAPSWGKERSLPPASPGPAPGWGTPLRSCTSPCEKKMCVEPGRFFWDRTVDPQEDHFLTTVAVGLNMAVNCWEFS